MHSAVAQSYTPKVSRDVGAKITQLEFGEMVAANTMRLM
jgi:hypothetical protein